MRSRVENVSNGVSVFAAVVDAGTFAAAATVVGMSPPGVSRAIARLEKRLGLRLFNRTTRSVSLTEEGRRFYEQVVPLLAALEEAALDASGSAAAVCGRLRVNVDPLCYRALLGPPLDEFIDAHGQLELELSVRDRLGDLVSDGFDVALRFGEPPGSTLVATKLLESRVVTVAAPAYVARHGQPQRPEDLQGRAHRAIVCRDPDRPEPLRWEFRRPHAQVAVAAHGRLVVTDPAALVDACVAGFGIAQLLAFVADPLIADGRLVNLFPDWTDERRPLYVYHASKHYMPAKMRAFLDFVVAWAAGLA